MREERSVAVRISVFNSGFTNRPVWTKERFTEAPATSAPASQGSIIETMSLSDEVSQKITALHTDLDLDCIQKVMGMIFKFESPSLKPLQKQIGGGPARGLGQYEILPNREDKADKASGRAETAYTRARNFYENNDMKIPTDHWTKALADTGTFDIVEARSGAGLTGNEQYEMAVLDHLMGENYDTPSFTKTIKKCGDGTLTSEMVRIYHRDYHKVTDAHSDAEVTRWNDQNKENSVLASPKVLASKDIGVTQSGNSYTITLRKIPYKIPTVWGWDKNYKGRGSLLGRWVNVLSDSVSYPATVVGESDSYTIDGKVITITGKYRIYGTTSDHDTIFKVSYAYLDNYDPNWTKMV